MMHQVNYSQINQFCRITALCLWTVFHCMPLHRAFTLRPFTRPSKLRELQPDQHMQTIEKVGLRDRGRCGTGPEEPLLFIVRPAPKVLVPALFCFFFFFWLHCSQSPSEIFCVRRWTAAHQWRLWLTPDRGAAQQRISLQTVELAVRQLSHNVLIWLEKH